MSRKQDRIVLVLRYFEDSELAVAEQGLALAKAIVQGRRGPAKKTKRAKPAPVDSPA